MGGALIRGMLKTVPAWQVAITDKDGEKALDFARNTGVIASDLEEISSLCHYIFLAVKPQALKSLSEELMPLLEKRGGGFVIVSMAAGITTDRIKELFGDHPVIRIMPNLAVSAGEGMILYTATPDVSEEDVCGFTELMERSGKLLLLSEELFDAGTSVSGCGPAFVCQFIDALTEGGVSCGLDRDDARFLAEQTLFGTAKLLLQTKGDPTALRIAVCSPGGSTIEGVKSLENDGIDRVIGDAVRASYKRNVELGKH